MSAQVQDKASTALLYLQGLHERLHSNQGCLLVLRARAQCEVPQNPRTAWAHRESVGMCRQGEVNVRGLKPSSCASQFQ